jgi:hypothetical protein
VTGAGDARRGSSGAGRGKRPGTDTGTGTGPRPVHHRRQAGRLRKAVEALLSGLVGVALVGLALVLLHKDSVPPRVIAVGPSQLPSVPRYGSSSAPGSSQGGDGSGIGGAAVGGIGGAPMAQPSSTELGAADSSSAPSVPSTTSAASDSGSPSPSASRRHSPSPSPTPSSSADMLGGMVGGIVGGVGGLVGGVVGGLSGGK